MWKYISSLAQNWRRKRKTIYTCYWRKFGLEGSWNFIFSLKIGNFSRLTPLPPPTNKYLCKFAVWQILIFYNSNSLKEVRKEGKQIWYFTGDWGCNLCKFVFMQITRSLWSVAITLGRAGHSCKFSFSVGQETMKRCKF